MTLGDWISANPLWASLVALGILVLAAAAVVLLTNRGGRW